MSLSETQEIMSLLQEIMQMLDNADGKIDQITGKVTGSSGGSSGGDSGGADSGGSGLSLRQQFRTLNMMGIVLEQMTGNKNVDVAVRKFSQLLMVLMRLRMLLFVISELEAGTLGGPWGLAYAAANAIGFGMSLNTLGQ